MFTRVDFQYWSNKNCIGWFRSEFLVKNGDILARKYNWRVQIPIAYGFDNIFILITTPMAIHEEHQKFIRRFSIYYWPLVSTKLWISKDIFTKEQIHFFICFAYYTAIYGSNIPTNTKCHPNLDSPSIWFTLKCIFLFIFNIW